MSTVSNALKQFFAKSDNPVLFSGAGVSSRAGLPVWHKLLERMMEYVRSKDALTAAQMGEQIREGNLTKAAEYFVMSSRVVDGAKYEFLVAELSSFDVKPLKPLASLPFRACFTTNFDRCLLQAFPSDALPMDYRYGDQSFSEALWQKQRFMARIHGSVEAPRTIVLTDASFERLINDHIYRDLLVYAFTRLNVLFVGFSFYDPAIRHVLEQVRRDYGSAPPGRHVALVPASSSNELMRHFAQHNIETVQYRPDEQHRELWEGIADYAKGRTGSGKVVFAAVPALTNEPFDTARKYLASCYARVRLGNRIAPLKEVIVEGMVAGIVQKAAPKGVRLKGIIGVLHDELGISTRDASSLVDKAAKALKADSLCRWHRDNQGDNLAWAGPVTAERGFEESIDLLIESARDRAVVQEGWHTTTDVANGLRQFFKELIFQRGWDLGAAYANNRPPEIVDIATPLRRCCTFLSALEVERLQRVCESMLTRPSERESEILSQLGRVSFALELVLQSPRTILFHSSVLPERIYFDANVLLPALTPGHPFHFVYRSTIEKLREAATRSATSLQLMAYFGFLNEVVSHRRLAIRFMDESGDNYLREIRRTVAYYGTTNINVFIGAYANHVIKEPELRFTEFLQRHAPYTNEAELTKWLTSHGIQVVKDLELRGPDYAGISLYLQKSYSSGLASGKDIRLIEHDSTQLAGLAKDRTAGRRAIFVSADKTLRELLNQGPFAYLARHMISHVGLAQMIDLLVGTSGIERSMTGLIWVSKSSKKTDSLRSYLTALALMEYDEGLAMEMPLVVDKIAEEMNEALAKADIDPDSPNPEIRAAAFRTMEMYEAQYFQGMRETIERRQRQGS